MQASRPASSPVSDRLPAGILDTSVVIDLHLLTADELPVRSAIAAITLAELTAGPLATDDPVERAVRQDRLQRTEAAFDPIPFGGAAARAYGRVYASVVAVGRKPRRRIANLLIAATALAEELPLCTRNPDDFTGLKSLLDIVAI